MSKHRRLAQVQTGAIHQVIIQQDQKLADSQWAKPTDDGITSEARYWIDDMYMITVVQVQASSNERRSARSVANTLERICFDAVGTALQTRYRIEAVAI